LYLIAYILEKNIGKSISAGSIMGRWNGWGFADAGMGSGCHFCGEIPVEVCNQISLMKWENHSKSSGAEKKDIRVLFS